MVPRWFWRIPITLLVSGLIIAIHVIDPPLTEFTYFALSPWIHSGIDHLVQNLAVFLLAGFWTEKQVEWMPYVAFVISAAYLSLYIPVAFEYGGLSNGASGLTRALVAYAGFVQFTGFLKRIETLSVNRLEITKLVLHFGLLLVIASYLLVTVARFGYYVPRPEGMSVSSHFTGIVLGFLWSGYRFSDIQMLEGTMDGLMSKR